MKIFLLAPLLFFLFSCNNDHNYADKVFIGKTWTGNETNEWAEGLAVIADTIAFVGNENDLRKWIGEKTEVVELDSV
ncbi:MAG TPA: hypothetical protein VGD17_15105, partial [Chitinophagaceae bacterium]